MEKKQVVFKILIKAHTCQISKKNVPKQQDVTERLVVGGREWTWTQVQTAQLPNKMESAAMVSIYNTLYLTGKNEYVT